MKKKPSNLVLASVLGTLLILIVGLTVGVFIVQGQKKTDEQKVIAGYTVQGASRVVEAEGNIESTCDIIEAGTTDISEDKYKTAIEDFEASENEETRNDVNFRNCYVSLRNYYSKAGDEEKTQHYNEIIIANMENNKTEEDLEIEKKIEEDLRNQSTQEEL